ncbi:FAD-binding oxidoreductase [Cyclobacteriaceae bacterium YHN15]|nr:FAD-binding oxidoreductase [Cyclobacteriaceae bacterium YHN15]
MERVDAVVIGGGFYGTNIALFLAKQKKIDHVVLIEKENKLISRASSVNQARIHNGYHYPRSLTTASRSRVNMNRFIQDWPDAVFKNFTKLYAIAKTNSKVSSKQFVRFCKEIGAEFREADSNHQSLFNPRLIDEIFLVEEYAFDAAKLSLWVEKQLLEAKIDLHLNTKVRELENVENSIISLKLDSLNGQAYSIETPLVINCTYSGLNQFQGKSSGRIGLKHEIAEIALLKMPEELQGLGITVMDGPFFSTMPFPSRIGVHSLTHVRYTPHFSWQDTPGIDPYLTLNKYDKVTQSDRMIRDAGRYLPSILKAQYVDSLFEVKSVLQKNEIDDGRPIMFEKDEAMPGLISFFGGKIDNIYDALEKLSYELNFKE